MSIVTSLVNKLTAKKQTADERFYALAREVAQGREPDVDRLTDALGEAGRTVEDLATFVATYDKRKSIADALAALPGLRKEQERLEALCDTADKTRDQALAAHAAAVAAPVARIAEIRDAIQRAAGAEQTLLETCEYPSLVAKHEKARATAAALEAQARPLRTAVKELPALIKSDREQMTAATVGPSKMAQWGDEAEKHERELKAAQAELPGVEKQLSSAQADVSRLEAEMRKL